MDKQQITLGKITLTQSGERIIITHHGKDKRVVSVSIDAAKLERFAMRILREEAFA